MIKDIFAPVVKTLFIPEGNPGVQEIKEIRALPRMTKAEGDEQELIISGEMDLSIRYLPINDADEDIPWRSIELKENESWNPEENEEQVISRLKSALKEGEDEPPHERFPEEVQLRISVPFSLDVDTEGLYRDHPLTMNPSVDSSNWFLVSPKAIEYEAVLKLITEEDEKNVLRDGEPIILEDESREISSAEPIILEDESREVLSAEPIILEEESREILNAMPILREEVYRPIENERVPFPQPRKMVKAATKEKTARSDSSGKQVCFQIKFYRVQAGENLDDVADKFGLSRERIRAFNAVNEEEIKTGLLLSIPRS